MRWHLQILIISLFALVFCNYVKSATLRAKPPTSYTSMLKQDSGGEDVNAATDEDAQEEGSTGPGNNPKPVPPPEPVTGRGVTCDICQEVVAASTKTFPCSDGELCGFNCGSLCNGQKPKMDDKAKAVSSMSDFQPEPSPCERGEHCKVGVQKFLYDPEVRSFIQYLTACQVKPYAICSALHRKFPDLKPTCDSKDCRDSAGNLLTDKCTGIHDYNMIHSDDCEKNMQCTNLKNEGEDDRVSEECIACYWIVKAFPVFNGLKCSDLPEKSNFQNCQKIYTEYNIDKEDIIVLVPEDREKAQLEFVKLKGALKKEKRRQKKMQKKNKLAKNLGFLEETPAVKEFSFVDKARDDYLKRIKENTRQYTEWKPWFCDKCDGVCDSNNEKEIMCKLASCRGSGSPMFKTKAQLVTESQEAPTKSAMNKQIDTCYTSFMEFQQSMKARALIATNQRDPTSNDLNTLTPEMATCQCLGQCPYTSTEDTVLDGGFCKYDPDSQMPNMEDLSAVGFKLIFDTTAKDVRSDDVFKWVNSQQGFDKYALEKMDKVLPFVDSKKKNDEIAEKELLSSKLCKQLTKD